MVEKSLEVLERALNGANKAGVFTLQESEVIAQALRNVSNHIHSTPIAVDGEDASKETVTKKQSK